MFIDNVLPYGGALRQPGNPPCQPATPISNQSIMCDYIARDIFWQEENCLCQSDEAYSYPSRLDSPRRTWDTQSANSLASSPALPQ